MNAKTNLLAAATLLAFITTSALGLTVPVAQNTSSTKTGRLTSAAGKSTYLAVSDDQVALLEFDLSNLDVVPATIDPGNIKSVILQLYVIRTNATANLNVLAVTGTWSETFTATYEPLPSIDSTNVLGTIPVPKEPYQQFVSVDITAAAVAALQSATNLDLAIETSTKGAILALGSKSGPALGYAATLDIESGFPSTSGSSYPFSIGTVTSGTAPGVALGETSSDQILNFTLVPGTPGAPGTQGDPGPANTLAVGTVTTGTAVGVTITGNAPNQTLNFAIPNGQLTGGDTAVGENALASESGSSAPTTSTRKGTSLPADSQMTLSNTAFGYNALASNNFGVDNTAVGADALAANNYGGGNTAVGEYALNKSSGSNDTAVGINALSSNSVASNNTAVGAGALEVNDSNGNDVAVDNTATGYNALSSNTVGYNNTADGSFALDVNLTGTDNTAEGFEALFANGSTSNNTAVGATALKNNDNNSRGEAVNNTAMGASALGTNVDGYNNTADGAAALANNDSDASEKAIDNTATGFNALGDNVDGYYNASTGANALFYNVKGHDNTADGSGALYKNDNDSSGTAVQNTGLGSGALFNNVDGHDDTAIGFLAGEGLSTGTNDIYIGSNVDVASGNESNCTRIGNPNAPGTTVIAGIATAAVGGNPVYINSNGQLGLQGSSQRFKEDIKPMGDASDVLLSLRPVTFHYKPAIDPKGIPQFGLVAEEVQKACPDLAIYDSSGKVFSVRYDAVNAMLLNEFLKEHQRVETLARTVAVQEQRNADQQKQIEALAASMERMTRQMNAVAQRLNGKEYQPVANGIGSVAVNR